MRARGNPDMDRTVADDAQTALLLEAGTDKPGNVGPSNDHEDTTFHQFLAGAAGAREGLERAAEGDGVGASFLSAVRGSSAHTGGNTQFGALLLLVPLSRAAAEGDVADAGDMVRSTTPEDARGFYASFDHTDVYVGDTGYGYDVRDPGARDRLVEDGVSLYEVMEGSAHKDAVAREWTEGFERSLGVGRRLRGAGDSREAILDAYLRELADHPDTLVAERRGEGVARRVSEGAEEVVKGERTAEGFDRELRDDGVNPGATADIVAAGIFVALRRGWPV